MKSKISGYSIFYLIMGILFFILSIIVINGYGISFKDMRLTSASTKDYILNKSPVTIYEYTLNGENYTLKSRGYSATNYITKKHLIVYDASDKSNAFLLSNYFGIFIMIVVSLLLIFSFILSLYETNIFKLIVAHDDGSIGFILIYLSLLSLGIFMFKNNYIFISDRENIRAYVVESTYKKESSFNDEKYVYYAIVNYTYNNQEYKKLISSDSVGFKIGESIDLDMSKKNPYHSVTKKDKYFSIIYFGFLFFFGIFILVNFIRYKFFNIKYIDAKKVLQDL